MKVNGRCIPDPSGFPACGYLKGISVVPDIIWPTDFEIMERVLARVCDDEASDEQLQQMAEMLVALWNTGTRDEDALEQVLKAWCHNLTN